MGNNAGTIAGCAVGVAGGSLAEIGGTAACLAFIPIPPLAAACAGGTAIAGFVGTTLGAQACKDAAAGNDFNTTPADPTTPPPPPPEDGQRRRKRQYGYQRNWRGSSSSSGPGRGGYSQRFYEFELLDANKDGFISNADIPIYIGNNNLKTVIMSLMMMFPLMDSNGDGRLSQSEAMAFRRSTTTDEGQLRWMYRMIDGNQDDRLTPQELVQTLGTCSFMGQRPDAWTQYKQSMKALNCEKKGFVEFSDVMSFWAAQQPKLVQGSDTLWNFENAVGNFRINQGVAVMTSNNSNNNGVQSKVPVLNSVVKPPQGRVVYYRNGG